MLAAKSDQTFRTETDPCLSTAASKQETDEAGLRQADSQACRFLAVLASDFEKVRPAHQQKNAAHGNRLRQRTWQAVPARRRASDYAAPAFRDVPFTHVTEQYERD